MNHAEQPNSQLTDRLRELVALNQDWQGEQRKTQLSQEISYIVFEQMSRYAESRPDEAAVMMGTLGAQL